MVGAFEQLLGSTPGKEDALAKAFLEAHSPRDRMSACPRLGQTHFDRCVSVCKPWIRDFFRTRGELAHGRKTQRYPAAWPLQEHLLLAAFAFPMAAKSLLAKEGLYSPTRWDRVHINAFEKLAAKPLLGKLPDGPDSGDYPWNRVLADTILTEPANPPSGT